MDNQDLEENKPSYIVEWQKWWINKYGKDGCYLGKQIEPIWLQMCQEDKIYGSLHLKCHWIDDFRQADYMVVRYIRVHLYNKNSFEQLLSEMIVSKKASINGRNIISEIFEGELKALEQLFYLVKNYTAKHKGSI
jgi:hypothetical protein